MKTKLQVNNVLILTEFYKISYILSCLANNALAQVSLRLDDKSTKPFITAKKIFNMLTAAFGNLNKLKN